MLDAYGPRGPILPHSSNSPVLSPPRQSAPTTIRNLDPVMQGYTSGRIKYETSLNQATQILSLGGNGRIKEFLDYGSKNHEVRVQSLIVDALVIFAGRGPKESKSLLEVMETTDFNNKDFKWLMVQGLGRIGHREVLPYLERLAKDNNEDYLVRFWANVAISTQIQPPAS